MPPLVVPVPTLTVDAVALEAPPPPVATIEKPIELRSGAVTLPDGTPLGQEQLATAGYLVYRRTAAAAAEEVWDEAAGAWTATPADPTTLQPTPLAFEQKGAQPWFSVVVAAGQKDGAGGDRFTKATAGYPRYFFRTFFAPGEGLDAAAALSGPTPEVHFVSAVDTLRAGIVAGSGQTPQNATEVHLFLRNAALELVGAVSIFDEGGQARIELAKWDGASSPVRRVSLRADGMLTVNDVLEISTSGNDATIRCPGTLTLTAAAVRAENFTSTP